jgi:signal transduction histidine kinase
MWIEDLPAFLAALTPARVAVWPALGGAGVTLMAAVRDGRRRTALNERLHEVRRPLQALALLEPVGEGASAAGGPLEMAAAALARLDREINGEGEVSERGVLAVRPLLEAGRRRWRRQAELRGARIEVRWDAGEAAVEGDRIDLAAALDNLIANALEHGGPRVELAADRVGGRICLAVVDSGSGAGRRVRDRDAVLRGREARRRHHPRTPFGRFAGKSRHGHGLRLVRRTAIAHDGTFALHKGEHGTSAVLELPLLPSPLRTPHDGSQGDRDAPARTPHDGSQGDRDDPERTSTLFVREGSSQSPPSPTLRRGPR